MSGAQSAGTTGSDRLALLRRRLAARGLAAADQAITPRDPGAPVPLTAAQRRMWFLQRFQPHSAANNICVGIRLTGDLDATRLHRALRDTVARHEILRTTYATGPDGNPVQVVRADRDVPVSLMDFSRFPEREREAMVDDLALGVGARAFDLAADPPLWLSLVRMGPREHVLLLVAHHIAWDDSSWLPLLREVADRYSAEREPAALELSYGDYAVWENSAATRTPTPWTTGAAS
ncbi:condensation domain-containing protein [Actinokineospora soli]|uniref:Condensation domain-containing protein n=1 Tax=Actinokineospora soli TaxID=1048753 RepID=A0ABW2TN37_9PSEU